MKLWHGILLMMLILTLPLAGCGESSEDTDLQNYLMQVEPLIEEISDISSDFINMVEDAGPFGLNNIDQILATYSERFGDLLSRFEAIEYPKDAVKLREYTIDIISNFKQMVDELVAYAATLDTKHMDRAESYAADAEESHLLAIDEWDKLTDIAGEEDGISIFQIFLGILFFGVAAVIAMFVLELTLGVGFGIIAGITVAIGAIVKKIKGS